MLTQANSTMSNWRLASACGGGEVDVSKSVELGNESMLSSMPTCASWSLIIAMSAGRKDAGALQNLSDSGWPFFVRIGPAPDVFQPALSRSCSAVDAL